MDTKVCTKCGIEKQLDSFPKNRTKKSGYSEWCKQCNKEYKQNNKDKIRMQRLEYRKEHRDKECLRVRNYYKRNREKKLFKDKEYREEKKTDTLHKKTRRLIYKLNLRPDKCPLCGSDRSIEAHHPDYTKRYEIVFVCASCHKNIHAGNIECPIPIDLRYAEDGMASFTTQPGIDNNPSSSEEWRF